MIFIHGIGHFHPENVIDNAFLEGLNIETNNEWIMERVGILARRTVLDLGYIRDTYNVHPASMGSHIQCSNTDLGVRAGRIALQHAGLLPEHIGMVIAGGSLPQYSLPAEACMVAAGLGIEAFSFDLNSACSTFAAQMHLLNQMDPATLPEYILVVITESMTRSVNFRDRRVAVLWGDGAVALVVSKTKRSNMYVTHTRMTSKPSGCNIVTTPAGGHFVQDGPVVQKFAIKRSLETIEALRLQYQLGVNDHYYIGHQANLRMLSTVCKLANISEERHLYNVDQFGNCGAAGAPIVLSQNWLKFRAQDTIMVVVVGAGLSWGGMIIKVE